MERVAYRTGSAGEHDLQRELATQGRAEKFYAQQMLDHLNEQMRSFIAHQEMLFVSTADANGECDSSFRAGPPGFIHVLDAKTLAYPEYRGNGVMASLGNITENGHVGLLLIDFFRNVIGLHINGTAEIVEDGDLLGIRRESDVHGIAARKAERWVVVTVIEAYIHCSKHIPRLAKVPHNRHWGTDDVKRKGGDFFDARATPRIIDLDG